MIKNLIFDIGNVLADFGWKEYLVAKGFDENMIRRIAKASVYSEYWNEFDRGAWSEKDVMAEFIKNDPEIEQELHMAYDNIKGMVTPRDYAVPWLKELKEEGFSIYYLSNFSEKAYYECSEALDFVPLTNGGIFSFQVKMIKPEKEIYDLLLTKYGLLPEECVFFDDTEKNVDAAKKCGIHGIVFQNKEQAQEELRALL